MIQKRRGKTRSIKHALFVRQHGSALKMEGKVLTILRHLAFSIPSSKLLLIGVGTWLF